MKLTLAENAYSFFEEAVRNSAETKGGPHRMKFALFNLVQAIELFVKYRLSEEHEILVYENINTLTRNSSGEYNEAFTVTPTNALKRLTAIADVKLHRNDTKNLELAQRWRNQIAHYAVNIDETKHAIPAVFSVLLGFVGDFHQRQFGKPLYEFVSPHTFNLMKSNADHLKEMIKRVKKQIRDERVPKKDVIKCELCEAETVVIKGDEGKCRLCAFVYAIQYCLLCKSRLDGKVTRYPVYGGPARGQIGTVCQICIDKDREATEKRMLSNVKTFVQSDIDAIIESRRGSSIIEEEAS